MRLLPCTASTLLLAAMGAAHADASIQLYGVADLGLITTDHGNPSDPNGAANVTPLPTSPVTYNPNTAPNGKTGKRVTSLINGGLSPSRWGVKGSEDLGDGLSAVFTLESPINVATGTVPNSRIAVANSQANTPFASQEGSYDGQLFARESTIGLKSKTLGELRFGRQQTVMADAIGQFDVNSGFMDPLGYNGGYNAGGFTAEARWDNSIKYGVSFNENFRAQLMYRLGGVAGSMNTRNAEGATLYFTSGPLKLAAAYLNNHDSQLASGSTQLAPGSVPSNPSYTGTLKLTFANTYAYALFGAYQLNNDWNFKGGWEQIHTENPFNPAYDQSIGSMSGVSVTQWAVASFTNPRIENMYWLGASYAFAPSWTAKLGYYQRNTNRYGANAKSATMADTSNAKYYVGEVIRNLGKRTDLYGLVTESDVSGPAWAGFKPHTLSLAVGMRHVF